MYADDAGGSGDNTLTVWTWDPNFNVYAIEKAAEIYAQDHEGFKVEVTEVLSDDIETNLTTAASAGDYSTLPDIFLMQDNSFQKYVTNYPDIFTDLTDSGVDFSQFAEAKVAYSVVDGKNYGVPFDNGAVIAAYRMDYLEQAGFTIDDFTDITWSDFMEKAKVVKEKTGQPILTSQAGSPDLIMEMLQSCGASLFNEDGSVNIVGNDDLKECMEIQSGKWAITNMPRLERQENATNYSNNGGSSWAISSNCDNPELAMDFLNATFAGSTELYDDLLTAGTGAIATWSPAKESDEYAEPSEFFGGDAVNSKILGFSEHTPSNVTGPFYYDARNAVGTALSAITQQGADMDSEIEKAQDTVEFNMGG